MESLTFCAYADLHYKKGMYIASIDDMRTIIDRADKDGAAFAIHLGDFCNDYIRSPELFKACLDNYNGLPVYGIYGNHELESAGNSMGRVTPMLNNQEVTWGTSDGKIWDGTTAYYSFDIGVFRIIGLDSNYSLSPEGNWQHNKTASWGPPAGNKYPNSLGSVQLAWLENMLYDAARTGKHCLVFAHVGYSGIDESVYDAEMIRAIYKKANSINPATVIASFNGHYHNDTHTIIDNVVYLGINTVRNCLWISQRVNHYTTETYSFTDYDEDGMPLSTTDTLVDKLTMGKNTWFSAKPLSAIITVTADGIVTVNGEESEWYAGVIPDSPKSDEKVKITSGVYNTRSGDYTIY